MASSRRERVLPGLTGCKGDPQPTFAAGISISISISGHTNCETTVSMRPAGFPQILGAHSRVGFDVFGARKVPRVLDDVDDAHLRPDVDEVPPREFGLGPDRAGNPGAVFLARARVPDVTRQRDAEPLGQRRRKRRSGSRFGCLE